MNRALGVRRSSRLVAIMVAVAAVVIATGVVGPRSARATDVSSFRACPLMAYVAGNHDAYSVDPTSFAVTNIRPAGLNWRGDPVAASPDGSTVVWTRGMDLLVWFRATDTSITMQVNGAIQLSALAFTPDGTRLWVTDVSDNFVAIYDTTTWTEVNRYALIGQDPLSMVMTPDGSQAWITMGYNSTVNIIDIATGQFAVESVGAPGVAVPSNIAVSPDGSAMWVSNRYSSNVTRIQVADHAITTIEVGGPSELAGIAVTGDGASVWVAAKGPDSLRRIDASTNTYVPADDIALTGVPKRLTTQPGSARMWVSLFASTEIDVFDMSTRQSVTSVRGLTGDQSPGVIAFSECPLQPDPPTTTSTISSTTTSTAGTPV